MDKISKAIQRKILFNPGPATTSREVKESLLVPDICPREKEFGELIDRVRMKITQVENAEEKYEAVLISGPGTAAMESCLGIFGGTKKVLILENGAYGERMAHLCRAIGVNYETINFPWNEAIDFKLVETVLEKRHHEFHACAVVHHETTTGLLNSLEEFYYLCLRYGMYSIVDAMSSFAGIPLNLDKTPFSFVISSANKCLHSFAGISFILANKEIFSHPDFDFNQSIGFSLNFYQNYRSQKEKSQFLYTPPVQILYALERALDDYFKRGGVFERYQEYSKRYFQILSGMRRLGFTTSIPDEFHSRVLTTYHLPENLDFSKLHDYLYEQGLTIYPGKLKVGAPTFRLSNIGELSENDIERFLFHLSRFLESKD